MNALEEGRALELDFGKLASINQGGLLVLPVALQNADTGEVLFIGYANQQALSETLSTRQAVLWSTSRNELWHKGAHSGDLLDLVEVRVNCEQNSLVYRVRPRQGGVCHTLDAEGNARTGCYYRSLEGDGAPLSELDFGAGR
ncbi:MAG: phosphoribosyl-AMP cyclohydrolase [Myxococcota bacterium]